MPKQNVPSLTVIGRDRQIYAEARKGGSIVRLVMTIPGEDAPTADFLCWGRAAKNPEKAMRRAVREYLKTPQGKAYAAWILGAGSFNWGDAINEVPADIWERHGLRLLPSLYSTTITVEHDERLNDKV